MDFVPVAAMAALILKIVDLFRYASARDYNAVITQLLAWGAGIVVAFLVAKTAWAAGIPIAGVALSKLGAWSIVFAGVTIGSTGSALNDFRKAFDNTDSAKIPTLTAPAGPQEGP